MLGLGSRSRKGALHIAEAWAELSEYYRVVLLLRSWPMENKKSLLETLFPVSLAEIWPTAAPSECSHATFYAD